MRFLAVLGLLSTMVVGDAMVKSENALRNEFVRSMQSIEEERQMASQQESLQERLLKAARKVTPELIDKLKLNQRQLNNDDDAVADDDDDYYTNGYSSYKSYTNYGGGYSSSNDLTNYALKYVGCQNVHTWSDERVEAGLDPMAMERYVVLRLCEANTCSAYNKWGCNYNYGEYVMPMEDYLSVMSTHHFQQYNRYCETCSDCMTFDINETPSPTASPTPMPTASATAGDDDGGRALSYSYYGGSYGYGSNNNNYQKQLPWYVDEDGECLFQTVCKGYRTACNNYYPEASYYQDYFTCTQFQLGNKVGYVGPHCRSDGLTIGIGIFEDAYCNSYVGDVDEYSIQSTFDDDKLSLFYDKTCISCRASDGFFLIKDAYVNDNMYTTYPLCGAVYDESAKCNLHMSSSSSLYTSQQETEKSVCSFIATLVLNTYTEFGDIIVQSDFNIMNWWSPKEYTKIVSPMQLVALILSTTTAVALSAYSCYLTMKLLRRKQWQPPRSITSPSYGNGDLRSVAGKISRMNSGIVAMRSYDTHSTRGGIVHGDMSYYSGSARIRGDVSTLTPSHAGAFA